MPDTDEQAEEERTAAHADREARQLATIEETVKGVVSGLTPQQRTFVIHYLHTSNATKSAGAAGYAVPDRQGSRLRKNPKIQTAIADYFRHQEMSAGEVVARLSQHARADYADYLRAASGGRLYLDAAAMIQDGKGHLVKRVTETKFGQSIEFYDSQAALVHVGRVHGIFIDKVKQTDWRDEALALLREGKVSADDIKKAFGDELAGEVLNSRGAAAIQD